MNELTSNLYAFVSKYRMAHIWNDPEYREFLHAAEAQEGRLRALLDDKGRQVLQDMLYEQSCLHAMEQEAIFQAALSLSGELTGLLRP